MTNLHTDQVLQIDEKDSCPKSVWGMNGSSTWPSWTYVARFAWKTCHPGTGGRTGADSLSRPAFDRRFSRNAATGLKLTWSAELRDGATYIVQSLEISATKDTTIQELVFVDTRLDEARQMGSVDGSVVVCGDVSWPWNIRWPRTPWPRNAGALLPASGQRLRPDRHGPILGDRRGAAGPVAPGFLYYLERRRAHPYRPFLHYNSWYHLNIGRPDNHMTEAECLEPSSILDATRQASAA